MDVAKTNYSLGAMDIEASFTAMRVLAEIIASDVSLLVTFNHAIDGVIQNNPSARGNPKALAQLDGYKRPLVESLSMSLQSFVIAVWPAK